MARMTKTKVAVVPINRGSLNAEACEYFAAKMVTLAVEDVLKDNPHAREAAEFLWTERAELFMDAAGYDPDFIRETTTEVLEQRFALA